ncbi:MAG: hypothetical protein AB4063_04270 [Crocosphaera sp.]
MSINRRFHRLKGIASYILFVPIQVCLVFIISFYAIVPVLLTDNYFWKFFASSLLALHTFGKLHSSYYERLAYIKQHIKNHQNATSNNNPYALLLRSFSEPDIYQTKKETIVVAGESVEPEYEIESFIGYIDEALDMNKITLIAFNSHLSLELNTDHEILLIESPNSVWVENFHVLALNAKAIIVLPEITEALVEKEISFIINHKLLEKTIFVMPALLELKPTSDRGDDQKLLSQSRDREGEIAQSVDKRWKIARKMFKNQGLIIPDYNEEGELFILQEGKQNLLAKASLHHANNPYSFYDAFRELLPYLSNHWLPVNEIYPVLKPEIKYKNYGAISSNPPGNSFPFLEITGEILVKFGWPLSFALGLLTFRFFNIDFLAIGLLGVLMWMLVSIIIFIPIIVSIIFFWTWLLVNLQKFLL